MHGCIGLHGEHARSAVGAERNMIDTSQALLLGSHHQCGSEAGTVLVGRTAGLSVELAHASQRLFVERVVGVFGIVEAR